jgi:hypothetical protein
MTNLLGIPDKALLEQYYTLGTIDFYSSITSYLLLVILTVGLLVATYKGYKAYKASRANLTYGEENIAEGSLIASGVLSFFLVVGSIVSFPEMVNKTLTFYYSKDAYINTYVSYTLMGCRKDE